MKVEIEDYLPGEGGFTIGKSHWDAGTLYQAVEDLKEFKMPLAGIDLDLMPWSIINIPDVLYHIKRINKASLKYPIILDPTGSIIDGWHRICKAILKGDEYIKVVRLKTMPAADRIDPSTK